MVRTAIWYGLGWLYLVYTGPALWYVRFLESRGQKTRAQKRTDQATGRLARTLFRLSGSSVRVTGAEHIPAEGAVLFVANHQGHMDSLVIHGFIDKPKGFISIVEALKIPILSGWMKQMQCVFLDRSDARQSSVCLQEAIETLKKGHSMIVFPEGHVSDGVEVNEFKRGWLRLATKSGVPIVPVSINGTYKTLSKDGSHVGKTVVTCVIGKPIETGQIKKEDEIVFVEQLKQTILSNLI